MCTLSTFAASGNTGSVTISIPTSENKDPKGIEFSICKVGDIVEGQYVLRSDYKKMNVDLNGIDNKDTYKDAIKVFSNAVIDNKSKKNYCADENGIINIEDLDEGVYYISSDGREDYGIISPVIITIPKWNEINNTYEYDLLCEPKVSSEIKKTPKTGDDLDISETASLLLGSLILLSLFIINEKKHKGLDNK